jgi:ABC-type phosphate transport system auxiliary subunit
MGIDVKFCGQNVNVSCWEAAKTIEPEGGFLARVGTAIKLKFQGVNPEQKTKICNALEQNQLRGSAKIGRECVPTNSSKFNQLRLFWIKNNEIQCANDIITGSKYCSEKLGVLKKAGLPVSGIENKINQLKARAEQIKSSYIKMDVSGGDVAEMRKYNDQLKSLNQEVNLFALNNTLGEIAQAAKQCFDAAKKLLDREPKDWNDLLTSLQKETEKENSPERVNAVLDLQMKMAALQVRVAALQKQYFEIQA